MISPVSSNRGVTTAVTVNGSNFKPGITAKLVKSTYTITAASVTYNSAAQLTASFNIPSNAVLGAYDLVISSSVYSSDITKSSAFSVLGTLAVTGVSRSTAVRGETITVTATGTDIQPVAAVKLTNGSTTINGTAVTLTGTTQISAAFVIPSGTAHGTVFNLTVTNASGDKATKTGALTVYAAPAITSFTPVNAFAGESVALTVDLSPKTRPFAS